VSVRGQDIFEPRVVVAPNGNAAFVWSRLNNAGWRVEARTWIP
jgi:hypothetical protein